MVLLPSFPNYPNQEGSYCHLSVPRLHVLPLGVCQWSWWTFSEGVLSSVNIHSLLKHSLDLHCKYWSFLEFVVQGCQCYKRYFMCLLDRTIECSAICLNTILSVYEEVPAEARINQINQIENQKPHSLLTNFWGVCISLSSLRNRTNKICICHSHIDTTIDQTNCEELAVLQF